MTAPSTPEIWLRGPVPGIPPALQPVAHALLQAVEDVDRLTSGLSAEELWTTPAGAASIGFHLRHMTGSLDRLFTYARAEPLTEAQRATLRGEQERAPDAEVDELREAFRRTVDAAMAQLRATPDHVLDEPRRVGRAGHPSTVRGLLHHAGEHTTRHAGQISTTVRIVRGR